MSNKDYKSAKDGSITDSQKQYSPLKKKFRQIKREPRPPLLQLV